MGQIIIHSMQKKIVNPNINKNKDGTWYWELMVLTHGIHVECSLFKGGN